MEIRLAGRSITSICLKSSAASACLKISMSGVGDLYLGQFLWLYYQDNKVDINWAGEDHDISLVSGTQLTPLVTVHTRIISPQLGGRVELPRSTCHRDQSQKVTDKL